MSWLDKSKLSSLPTTTTNNLRQVAESYFRSSSDPVDWAIRQAQFTPDPWQAQVLWSDEPRIILNCSRQSGKSSTTAHKALHHVLSRKNALVLLFSPSLRQSLELFRKITDILKILPHPPKLSEDNKLSLELAENGSRIVSLPSNEATTRGFSAPTLVMIDEASRVPDALYKAIRPMLAIGHGQLMLMSTPFGKRGFFYEAWKQKHRWQRIKITAPMCPRITPEFLAEELETYGEWWFKQEYYGKFVETIDQLFSYASIQNAMRDDIEPLFDSDPLGESKEDKPVVEDLLGFNEEELAA